VYEQNPLKEVVCQLRFPPILRIQTSAPDEFQEVIRKKFPNYDQQLEAPIALPPGSPQDLQELAKHIRPAESKRLHLFGSADEAITITLAQDSIALKTIAYPRWEQFREILSFAFDAFVQVYDPAFCSRIGLRYIDVVIRSELGLTDVPWSELIAGHIAGELSDERVAPSIVQALKVVTISLKDRHDELVTIRHGFGALEPGAEYYYIIDADFYTQEQTAFEQTKDILNVFNRRAGDLFRWCITERLSSALGPKQVPA
jgi:uncharacterized protein (TIGR04255 family)